MSVSLTGGTATFANKNVGTGKTVTLTGATPDRRRCGQLQLDSVGTATAEHHGPAAYCHGDRHQQGVRRNDDRDGDARQQCVSGDVVNVAYAGASFADANVGTGKPVSVTGISISGGADAGNYTLVNTTATTTANITLRADDHGCDGYAGIAQYSDKVTFKATISPGSAGSSGSSDERSRSRSARSRWGPPTWSPGPEPMRASWWRRCRTCHSSTPSLSTPAASGPMTPGAKTVTAVINGKNPNFTISDPTTSLTVTQEDARSTYTGDMLAFTRRRRSRDRDAAGDDPGHHRCPRGHHRRRTLATSATRR